MGDADHFTLLLEISQLVFGYDVGLGGLDSPTSNVMLPLRAPAPSTGSRKLEEGSRWNPQLAQDYVTWPMQRHTNTLSSLSL